MNQKRRVSIWGSLCVGILLPAWLLFAEEKPTETADVLLLRRIDDLEARVKELEKKLAQPYHFITPPLTQVTPYIAPAPSNLPPGAVPHEINGLTYYHLLLNDGQGDTTTNPPMTAVPAK